MEKGAKTDTQKGEMGPKTDQLKDRLTTGRDKDRLQNGKTAHEHTLRDGCKDTCTDKVVW
jgi:hypothetical protein